MKVNTNVRYALRAMLEIASSERPLLQKEIAERHNLSNKFLDQIINSLKVKGLIKNYKGKGSGYVLAKPADEISIFDVYTAFETIDIVECLDNEGICTLSKSCKARNFWNEYRKYIINFFKEKKITDLLT